MSRLTTGSPERWRRVEDLCERALALSSSERPAFLQEVCGSDEDLRREVESLLANASKADSFLDPSALAEAAHGVVNSPTAALTGRRIGTYEIAGQLGVGGMGEVYRARDTKLGRDVAIKVLPPAFTADRERLARFEREARVLASLNHPNVAAIYGLEQFDDFQGLILELVEGETLAGKIAIRRSGLGATAALGIARQIAEGLEAAHEKGIVHRDLKPANIKVTPAGTVKVLDFGLAKANPDSAPDLSQSPTITISGTREGVVLGTAAYMSPEQARGQSVDKRADIWAFGCVLFEMLTGRIAFPGATVSDHIAAILEREPNWSVVPASTPPAVHRLLRRCLEKDPKRRLHHIADARIEIDEALTEGATAAPSATSRRRGPSPLLASSMAFVLAAALAGWTVWTFAASRRSSPDRTITRFVIRPPASAPMVGGPDFDVSQDGSQLVYVGLEQGVNRVYLRRLDQFEPASIPGTEGARWPFFSPDGRSVGFWADGKLKRVAVTAAIPPVIVCDVRDHPMATWTTDNAFIFRGELGGGLQRVSAEGGAVPQKLTTPDKSRSEIDHHTPRLLPGGKALLFTIHRERNQYQVALIVLATGERKILIDSAFDARYSPTGHLVYGNGHSLFTVPFNLDRLEVTGAPVRLVNSVASDPPSGLAFFSLSPTGTLVYEPERSLPPRTLVWVDRTGAQTPLQIPPRLFTNPRLSPDGKRLAFAAAENERRDIWVYDLGADKLSRVTREGDNKAPLWTHDGLRLTYTSIQDDRERLLSQSADGSGPAESILSSQHRLLPGAWSVDHRALLYGDTPETDISDIFVLRLDAERRSQPLIHGSKPVRHPSLSPDGRWLAFSSQETGRNEVFVDAFPALGSRRQVSVEQGREPRWSRDGRELFFRSRSRMVAVPVDMAHGFAAGKPVILFDGPYFVDQLTGLDYDVAPDGRFLMIKPSEEEQAPPRLNVVLNWVEELSRRVPTARR